MPYFHSSSVLAALIASFLLPQVTSADEIVGYAFVQKDGSLTIHGQTIHLFGITIPPTGETCRFFERPVTCGPRAVLALDFRIEQDFVHCHPQVSYTDGSVGAVCSGGGEDDLSAWMLRNGWALAVPGAPYEYFTFEKIARSRGIGIWGIPIDNLPSPK